PDLRALELGYLAGEARAAQRLVEADGRTQHARQARVSHELVGAERLLEVEQARLVESAELALVLGPAVCAIRIDGERHVDPRHRVARGPHGDGVPAGRDL